MLIFLMASLIGLLVLVYILYLFYRASLGLSDKEMDKVKPRAKEGYFKTKQEKQALEREIFKMERYLKKLRKLNHE